MKDSYLSVYAQIFLVIVVVAAFSLERPWHACTRFGSGGEILVICKCKKHKQYTNVFLMHMPIFLVLNIHNRIPRV